MTLKESHQDEEQVKEQLTAAIADEPSTLPLFFSRPIPLDAKRHAQAGIYRDLGHRFARQANSITILAGEFQEAAKWYPIVFSMHEPVTSIAVVGLEGENYFVGDDKRWERQAYVPAYVRKHPFMFMEFSKPGRLTLCIDEDASQFTWAVADPRSTERLFEADGKPTAFIRGMFELCATMQEQYLLTLRFCEALKALDLLTPGRIDAKLASGRTATLRGIQTFSQEKFTQLPDDAILSLNRQEFLPLIFAVIASDSNWQRLVDRANAR